MEDNIILRTSIRILIPFIFMYGLYIQFHGEYSPGGGFQAGVICAAAFITYGLVNSLNDVLEILSLKFVKILCSLGVLIYGAVGVVAMLKGGEFLNYSVLASDSVSGQKIGIIFIEAGVGLTVFSVIMIVFYMFAMRSSE